MCLSQALGFYHAAPLVRFFGDRLPLWVAQRLDETLFRRNKERADPEAIYWAMLAQKASGSPGKPDEEDKE